MRSRYAKRLVSGGLVLIAAGCLWFYFAPVGVGGLTTYVVTDGTSMKPRFHAGDLALVRSQGSYRVGEIVAYRSHAFHTIVLHRIVGREGARYLFKGDNNNFVDFEHPAGNQLLGALWLHVPGAGARLQSLRSPALVGALLGVATLLFAGAAFSERRRRRGRSRRAPDGIGASRAPLARSSVAPAALVVAAGLVALVPLVALAVLAFTRPATARLPFAVPFKQSGTFSYSARSAPGPIYAGNRAKTGDPLFTHVIDTVQLRFSYRFAAAATHSVAGRASLSANVASSSGWQTSFELAHPKRFRGDRAVLDASLDLRSLLGLLRRVEATTDVSGSYTLTLTPRVSTTGRLGSIPLHGSFSPQLRLAVSQLEVQPILPGGSAAGQSTAALFTPATGGSAAGTRAQPEVLSLGLVRLPVATARAIALGGIAVIMCAVMATLALVRPRRHEEGAIITARYGRLIVPVERVWQEPGVAVIDVGDIEALVRIAEHYDRSILHERGADGEAFWVTDESGQFRYAVGPSLVTTDDGSVGEELEGPLAAEVYADELELGGIDETSRPTKELRAADGAGAFAAARPGAFAPRQLA